MSNFKCQMSNLHLKSKIYLLFALCYLLFAIPAKAQGLSLGIWPPLLEVTIQPGKSITQVYKLRNTGETDLALTSKIVPFKPEGETGDINFATPGVDLGRHTGSETWFSFQNANLALGEKFLINLSITLR